MYNVSDDYKNQIKSTLRNLSYVKITTEVINTDAKLTGNVSSANEMYYSDSENIKYDYDIEDTYLTLEHNRFPLTGNHKIPIKQGSGTYLYQGHVGTDISDSTGVWTTPPKVTIDFGSNYYEFIGLTFEFDTIFGEYPTSLRVIAYNDGVEVFNQVVSPNKNIWAMNASIPQCNKIELFALTSNVPYRRFRLTEIILGVLKIFTDDSIANCELVHEVDPISSKLPKFSFQFTVLDANREYDPENPLGIYQYIEAKQPIAVKLGYQLNDGTIEWQDVANMTTNSEIKVNSEAVIPTVGFTATSVLDTLTQTYSEGKYYTNGRSLYDLATDVLMSAGLELDESGNNKWFIDDSLKTLISYSPLPIQKINVLLQLIANAGMCTLDVDRFGYIQIKPMKSTTDDFSFTLDDLYNPPVINKYPLLRGIDTRVNNIMVDSEVTQLAIYNIANASSTDYEFTFSLPSTNVTLEAGAGLTINGTPTIYANMVKVRLTGTGTLTVNGNKLISNYENVSVEFDVAGERCPISNVLITNKQHAINYATWVGDYLSRRNQYTLDNRGFPELDPSDNIVLDTLYTDSVAVSTISNKIKFDGTIKGTTTVLGR